jgi:hypothetical protein
MAEKRTIELEIKDNSKSLKAQLREAQQEVAALADKYGATSEQAVNAAKRAAELKDRIGDAKALTDAFNPDAKFKALSASLTGVAGGFSAVQGAMGLVGAEGEDVQKAMLKVQSAMALSQGLQSLGEARDSFKQLGAVATNTFKSLSSESSLAGKATAALGPIWKAVGISGKGALQGIRAGIAATGIGLLVVALGTIVAYWDDIKGLVSGVNSEMEKNQEISKMQVKNAERQVEMFDLSIASLKLQGKTEKEILELRIEQLRLQYKVQLEDLKIAENRKKLEVEAAKRNLKITEYIFQAYGVGLNSLTYILTGIIDGVTNGVVFIGKKINSVSQGFQNLMINALVLPIETALKGVNELLKIAGLSTVNVKGIIGDIKGSMQEVTSMGNRFIQNLEGTTFTKDLFNLTTEYVTDPLSKLIFDPEAIASESDATINELKKALATTKNEIDQSKLDIQQIEIDAANKSADLQKKIDEDKQKKIEEYNNNLMAYYDAMDKQRQDQLTSEREKEVATMEAKYEELYRIADAAGQDTSQLQKDQAEEYGAINKKYDDLELKAKKEREEEMLKMMKQMDDEAIKQFITAEEIKIAVMQEGLDKEAAMRKLAYDKEQIELQNKLDAGLITMEQFNAASRANNKVYQDGLTADNIAAYKKDIEEQKAAYEQKAALQTQYIDIATQAANLIKDLFGKSKAAQKTAVIIESAAGIAKMIISNKIANLGALTTPQALLTSGAAAAPVIAANNISLGLGIAANVAATAKALKEIGGGGSAPSAPSVTGGGGATGGGAGGGVMAPNFNVVGNNGLNQLAQLQQQPIKAYVVGSEVTTQQALDRNRINNGTL